MIRFWNLPHHLNENRLPEPFQNLLKEDYVTPSSTIYSEGKELDPYKRALRWVAEASKFLKLAQSKAATKLAEGEPEASEELTAISDLRSLTFQIINFIKLIRSSGTRSTGEQAVLSSSWLAAGIADFYEASLPISEYQTRISGYITRISLFLADPLLSYYCLAATLCLRQALLSLPEDPQPLNQAATGNLKLSILKRYSPDRVWGPYEYPNVSTETWKAMQQAQGMYGSGAGTVFWRQFLDKFYSRVKVRVK